MFSFDEENFKVSKHCQERYAERIAGKSVKLDINSYIAKHGDKIRNDIAKMLTYGNVIYRGMSLGGLSKNKEENTIILSGTWIVIYSECKNLVVTLYKIDLGLGEEFNKEYVQKVLSKINEVDERLKGINEKNVSRSKEIKSEIEDYSYKVEQHLALVQDIQTHISSLEKELETMNCSSKELELERVELISKLIGKKVQ